MPEPKIYGVDDVSDEDAEALRQRFLQRIQQDDLKDSVDPVDVRRTRTDPNWCKRFIAHGDLDMEKALNFMLECLKFRKSSSVNSLSLDTVDNTFFNKGVICQHGRDKDGALVCIFNARYHERASGARQDEAKKFLVYWMEKLEREERGRRITMFFDMGNAGLSNVDIPFISYLINLFKLYYPDMLNAIIVFDLPFIMNAAWRIVKNMLPAKSHQLIKFVSKKDASTLLAPDCCLTRWGGDDDWEYAFDPEECLMPPSPFLGDLQGQGDLDPVKVNGAVTNGDVNGHVEAKMTNGHVPSARRSSLKHHEGEAKFKSIRESPASRGENGEHASHAKVHFPDDLSTSSGDLAEGAAARDVTTHQIGDLLEISPGEEVWFSSGASGGKQDITITNIRGEPVAFKVKTTSPEKFRVRPSSGIVARGRQVTVQLQLCDGVTPQHVITDRFLLVAAGVQHERVPAKDMGRLWRSVPEGDKLEHCLRCAAAPALNDPLVALVRALGTKLEAVSAQLERHQRRAAEAEVQQGATRRRLGIALAVVVFIVAANLYLTFTLARC